jgi:hypothetical protein
MEDAMTLLEEELKDVRLKARQNAHLDRMRRPFKGSDSNVSVEHTSDGDLLVQAEISAAAEVTKKYIEKLANDFDQEYESDNLKKFLTRWLKENGVV